MTLAAALRRTDAIGLRARIFALLVVTEVPILSTPLAFAGQAMKLWHAVDLPGATTWLVATPCFVPFAVTGLWVDSRVAHEKPTSWPRIVLALVCALAIETLLAITYLALITDPLVGILVLIRLLVHPRPWRAVAA